MKTDEIKKKVAAKVAKGKAKVSAKCGKTAKACAVIALILAFAGCKMGEQPTAQRAQTSIISDNTFNITVAMPTPTNAMASTNSAARPMVHVEIGNQAQANETSGTETMSNTPTSTPQVSTPVQVDARYNDAAKTAADALGNAASGANTIKDAAAKVAELITTEPAKTETAEPAKTDAEPAKTDAEPGKTDADPKTESESK